MSGFPGWGPTKGTKESTRLGEIEASLLESANKIPQALGPRATDLHADLGESLGECGGGEKYRGAWLWLTLGT